MTQRIEFPQATNLGNVAEPSASQDAATKNYVDTRGGGAQYFDDVILVSTGNVTLGNTFVGAAFVTIAGNVTANYRAGDILVFLNNRSAPRYTVTFINLVGANTQVSFSPNLIQYVPNGATIYKATATRQIYTDLEAADNLTGSVSNNVLTISANIEYIPLVNIATAFTHGILTLKATQSAPNLTINGEIGPFIGDNSSITVTSTPWPPSIPAAYNQSYIFVADSTNTDWAGVGTPSRSPNGIIDIQWIKRPLASIPFTNAGIWYSANTTSQIYSAASINDAYNNNKVVTGVIFPELTHTLTTDTFGTKADVITAQPFVDGRLVTNIGAFNSPPTFFLNNSGGQVNSFLSGTRVFNILQASQPAIVSALLAVSYGIVQNTAGNWTLPSIPIYVSFTANPTELQYSTITQIAQNVVNNVLTITIQSTNQAYFQVATYPATLFLAGQKFTFATPPQSEILRLAGTVGVQTLQGLVGNINLTSQDRSVTVTVSNQNIDLSASGGGGSGWAIGGNSFSDTATKKLGNLTANPLSIVTNNIEAINVSYGLSTTSIVTATGVGGGRIDSFYVLPSGYSYLYKDGNLYRSDTIGGSAFSNIRSVPYTNGGFAAAYSSNVVVCPYAITDGGGTQGFIILTDTPTLADTITKTISPVLQTASGQNYDISQSFSVSPSGRNACVIMYLLGTNHCVALTNNFDITSSSISFPTVIRDTTIRNPQHAVYKDDNTLYVVGSGMDLYQMNVTTGAITSLGTTFSGETSVYMFYTNGALYISGYTGLYLVDQTTWRATKLSTYTIPGVDYWGAVPFDRSKLKFYFGNATQTIWEFDGTANVLVDGGHFQVSDSTSITLGDGNRYDAPLIAANEPTPTALSAGRLGQVLTSRGTGKTPHWGSLPTQYSKMALFTASGTNTYGGFRLPLVQRFNNIGVTLSASGGTNNQLGNLSGNYIIEIWWSFKLTGSPASDAKTFASAIAFDGPSSGGNDPGTGVSTFAQWFSSLDITYDWTNGYTRAWLNVATIWAWAYAANTASTNRYTFQVLITKID